jgi:hypothetical protein
MSSILIDKQKEEYKGVLHLFGLLAFLFFESKM